MSKGLRTQPRAGDRVQWAAGSGAGVRSWAYHGITRVHVRRESNTWLTVCGVRVPSASRLFPSPDKPGTNDCLRCARSTEGTPTTDATKGPQA